MKVTLIANTRLTFNEGPGSLYRRRFLDDTFDETLDDYSDAEVTIEYAGRLCYNSTAKLGQAPGFIQARIKQGHEDIIEHASASFLIEGISRSCLAQITRHRLFTYSVMSQRYVDADEAEWQVIAVPSFIEQDRVAKAKDPNSLTAMDVYRMQIGEAFYTYKKLRELGIPKEDRRFVLPEATATSLVMTGNFRSWRHFLHLRLDKAAQWEIREVAQAILVELRELAPKVFGDLVVEVLIIKEDKA